MTFPNNRRPQVSLRQRLRSDGTPAEAALWRALQRRQLGGLKFRRQFGVGPYVADFFCPEAQLAVELDGGVHASQRDYDDARSRNLAAVGVRVIRFENRAVFEHLDVVLAAILAAAREQIDGSSPAD